MSLSDETFLEFPEGDSGTFVVREANKKDNQVKLLTKHLHVSVQFAQELFDHGVIIRPSTRLENEGLLEREPPTDYQNALLQDSWFKRGVTWQKNSDGSFSYRTISDKERFVFLEIRRSLCNIADSREQALNDFIPLWHVDSNERLYRVVKDCLPLLRDTRAGQHLLWFRGQNQEYRILRSENVQNWLGYKLNPEGEISLVPSLAREVKRNPASSTWEWAFGGPIHYWKKAFFIWVLLRHPNWFSQKKGFIQYIQEVLTTTGETQMGYFLNQIADDPFIYEEADDFRQWFFAYHKYKSLPLIIQHYGMPTSTLDVTRDIEVALYFSTHRFDNSTRNFMKLEPTSENPVIYLFAEALRYSGSDETCIRNSEHVMQFSGPEPLPIPERVTRQKCGLLYGASIYGVNDYSDLLIGKIILQNPNNFSCLMNGKFLFPDPSEDDLYDTLLKCQPKLEYLADYR